MTEVTFPVQDSEQPPAPVSITTLVGIGVSWALLLLTLMIAFLATALPAITGAQSYSILTESMQPTYPPGTLIVVRSVDPTDLQVGSVITYQIESGKAAVITHRVTGVVQSSSGSRSFVTMGDNNAVPDPTPISSEQVRGEVWYAIPYLGILSNAREGIIGAVIPIIGVGLISWGGYLVASWSIGRLRSRS
ncbi:signal peptidase I [Microbacterium sp. NPDC055665]